MVLPTKRLVVAVAAASLLLGACASGASPAATVDGVEISDADVAASANLFRFLADVAQQSCGQPDPAGGETAESACNRFALTNLIEFEVAGAYAEANGIVASDDEVDQAMAQLEEQLGAEAFDEQLTANETTREALRELAVRFATLRDVATAIAEEGLGPDGIRARYDEDLASYVTVQVDHVLLETRQEAEDVYADVTAPGATRDDFLAIAKERSIDPSAEQNSGSLGSAVASTYVPEFSAAALALEEGDVSEPVKTQFGWHVIRMEDKEVTPFAEARDQILARASSELFTVWLREQLADGLEVNPRYGRFDLQTLTVQRIGSTDPDAEATATPQSPADAPVSP
ncbi:MAG TPA: peptidylprolyl isomerase [Actinomycetota bacterium]